MRTLKAAKPPQKTQSFWTFDIETGSHGQLLDIGLYTDNEYYTTYTNWLDFLNYLSTQTDKAVIFGHNAGGFDSLNLLYHILNDGITIIDLTGSIVGGTLMTLKFTYKTCEVEIRDSFLLLRSSLKKVLKAFGVTTQKLDVSDDYISRMEDYKAEHATDYYKYLKHDVIGLHQALTIFQEQISKKYQVNTLPMSVASLAMRVYKFNFLQHEIEIPSDRHQELARESYTGGRCEYVGDGIKTRRKIGGENLQVYENVTVIDVNSMYPAMMLNNDYPTGACYATSRLEVDSNDNALSGFYYVRFVQNPEWKYAAILATDFNQTRRVKNLQKTGETWLTSVEIDYLRKNGGSVEIIEGYYHLTSQPIFKDFIDSVYTDRCECRAAGDEVGDLIDKFILNNLYGKFAQKQENEKLQLMSLTDILDSVEPVKFFQELDMTTDLQPVVVTEVSKFEQVRTHPLIAALVTAHARCFLHASMEKIGQVIYCDTDSIFTQAKDIPIEILSDTELGFWKIEKSNMSIDVRGKKAYVMFDKEDIVQKIAQKGANTKTVPTICTEQTFSGYNVSPTCVKTFLRNTTKNPSEFTKQTRNFSRQLSTKEVST